MNRLGNINEDFFEQNSEYTILPEVKKLIRDNPDASKVMWAIYLIEDPSSVFYRIPREERILEVQKEYYNIDLKKYEKLVNEYCKLILTKEEWIYKIYVDEWEKIISALQALNPTNQKQLELKMKIMSNVDKMWKGLENIKVQLKDSAATQVRAGAKEGAREARIRKRKKS